MYSEDLINISNFKNCNTNYKNRNKNFKKGNKNDKTSFMMKNNKKCYKIYMKTKSRFILWNHYILEKQSNAPNFRKTEKTYSSDM